MILICFCLLIFTIIASPGHNTLGAEHELEISHLAAILTGDEIYPYFDAVNVRQTARTLALSSESSYRFERKVDQEMIEPASKRAANLIRDIAGGTEESFKDVGT